MINQRRLSTTKSAVEGSTSEVISSQNEASLFEKQRRWEEPKRAEAAGAGGAEETEPLSLRLPGTDLTLSNLLLMKIKWT